MDEEQLRIRGYLQTQAARLSPAEIAAKVRSDMEQLRQAAESVPPDQFDGRPGPEEWSANEIMAHVVSGGAGVGRGIVAALQSGTRPAPLAEDRVTETDQRRDASAWWQRLSEDREQLFRIVATAQGDEHLDVTWSHPMFGELNWREWLLFLRIHDLDHARQIAALAEPATRA
jgi:DinB family protein